MSKILWKPGTMVYPVPAVLVSCCDTDGKPNVLTIAWTGTICSNPAMAYISVRPSRYSYELIKSTGEFVINLTTKKLSFATDFCGVKSGRDIDKFKSMRLTPAKASHVKAPIIKESPINIECRVKEIIPLGSHDMFLAEVLGINADEKYINAKGVFDLSSADPICYSHGKYYLLGKQIGYFGHSVRKKKKKQ
jgi:flavin reductase (DIM6/NTAB) family NADH-FMN oxidoreductase RutF